MVDFDCQKKLYNLPQVNHKPHYSAVPYNILSLNLLIVKPFHLKDSLKLISLHTKNDYLLMTLNSYLFYTLNPKTHYL